MHRNYSFVPLGECITEKDKKDVKKQWTQKVYQVDDSPRYSGSATWVHVDGKRYWQNKTGAPLPRREYSLDFFANNFGSILPEDNSFSSASCWDIISFTFAIGTMFLFFFLLFFFLPFFVFLL